MTLSVFFFLPVVKEIHIALILFGNISAQMVQGVGAMVNSILKIE